MAAPGDVHPEGGLMDFFGLFLGIFGRLFFGALPEGPTGGTIGVLKGGAEPDPNG